MIVQDIEVIEKRAMPAERLQLDVDRFSAFRAHSG
jgi:hypothetical protein